MKRMKAKLLIPLLVAPVLLTRCSCDFFGTTGALFISEQDEIKLGTQFDTRLRTNDTARAEFPLYQPRAGRPDDTLFQAYVTNLAQEVLAAVPASERPDFPFKFTIIDKDIENAFAVPGGYVYIYTGIIKKMRDESELTGVLGHEIAHVTQHHYRDAMAKDAALGLLVQALVGNDSSQLVQLVAGSFFQLAELKVSRGNESEADEFGTKYEGRTGRNPLGIAKFFSRISGQGFAWFSSHPDPPDRVQNVTAQVGRDAALTLLAQDSLRTNYQARFAAGTKALFQK